MFHVLKYVIFAMCNFWMWHQDLRGKLVVNNGNYYKVLENYFQGYVVIELSFTFLFQVVGNTSQFCTLVFMNRWPKIYIKLVSSVILVQRLIAFQRPQTCMCVKVFM